MPTPAYIALQSPHEVIACPAEPLAALLLEGYDVVMGRAEGTAHPHGAGSWDRLHAALAGEDCRDESNSEPRMTREELDALPTAIVDETDMSIALPPELLPALRRRIRGLEAGTTPPGRVLIHDETGLCAVDGESVARALLRHQWTVARGVPPKRRAAAHPPYWVAPRQAWPSVLHDMRPLATAYPSGYEHLTTEQVAALRSTAREMFRPPRAASWVIPDDVARRTLAIEREHARALRRGRDAAYDMGR